MSFNREVRHFVVRCPCGDGCKACWAGYQHIRIITPICGQTDEEAHASAKRAAEGIYKRLNGIENNNADRGPQEAGIHGSD